MPSMQDEKFRALRLTQVGSINDMERLDLGQPTINDGWEEKGETLVPTQEQNNDTQRAFYLANGGVTPQLNDAQSEYWAGVSGTVSAEVQAVFNRMSALTQTEQDAIEALVDGMVAGGYYTDITEIYAPCLNGTDFLTGFKFMTLIQSAAPPTHTPGQFVEFSANSQHLLDSANFDTFATVEGFIAVYNVFTGVDTTGNSDLFGVADAGGRECYMRWRGNDTTDFNIIYNVTGATPRPAANQRPTGDLVGMGLEGTDTYVLVPGGIIAKAGPLTPHPGVPQTHPFQWHGQNLSGTPAAGNMANSRYSLMMHSNAVISAVAQGSVRALALQFLRDIGVTGVPVTQWHADNISP